MTHTQAMTTLEAWQADGTEHLASYLEKKLQNNICQYCCFYDFDLLDMVLETVVYVYHNNFALLLQDWFDVHYFETPYPYPDCFWCGDSGAYCEACNPPL